MDIKQLTLNSIQRYYKILAKTGSVDYSQVYKLLLLTFVEELFNDEFSWFITKEDYAKLTSIIECISKNTCIVLWDKTAIHIEPIKNYLEDTPIRISEENIIKLAETDILRLTNL